MDYITLGCFVSVVKHSQAIAMMRSSFVEMTSWGHGDGVSQCVMGRRESMCNGDENHENAVRDGQHEADFAILITGIFGCQSRRSCAGAEAIKSDKCIKSGEPSH
ncbi:hypothetical protein Tco_0227995 [Tanacetum coccineum]